MNEWKGFMEEIRRACERFGIDTESERAVSCSTCVSHGEERSAYPCNECTLNSHHYDFYEPWKPHFGEWVPVDEWLPTQMR